MKLKTLLISALIVIVAMLIFPVYAQASATGTLTETTVINVIDGDTIEVYGGYRVRLIGINAPETGEPGAAEATEFVRSLVYGRTVWLEPDGAYSDPYGRLRRYVWIERPIAIDEAEIRAYMLNALMLQEGLAEVMIVGYVRHEALFWELVSADAHQSEVPLYPDVPLGSFTPDGTATVIDNTTDEHGIEFFTFQTPEGNTFFLIIDRNRASNNVYFLNAVTEWDLMALAVGEAPPEPLPPPAPPAYYPGYVPDYPGQNIQRPTQDNDGRVPLGQAISENPELIALPIVLILAIGGVVYIRIIRPRKFAAQNQDDEEDYDDPEEDEYYEDYDDSDYDDPEDDEDG